MKSIFKSILVIMLATALMASSVACFVTNRPNSVTDSNTSSAPDTAAPVKTPVPTQRPDVASVSYTIDATAAYSSGKLSAEAMSKLDNNGLLVNNALVTIPKDTIVSDTFRVFGVYGVNAKLNSERDVTIQGISNGDCGENSHWILKVNGNEITEAFDSIKLQTGDEVLWLYVVD